VPGCGVGETRRAEGDRQERSGEAELPRFPPRELRSGFFEMFLVVGSWVSSVFLELGA
jgi:hypothetical protein